MAPKKGTIEGKGATGTGLTLDDLKSKRSLRSFTKIIEGAHDWKGEDELHLLAGIRGPVFGVNLRKAGDARVTNNTKDFTIELKSVTTDGAGTWTSDVHKSIIAPGKKARFTAPWDAQHNLHLFDYSIRGAIGNDTKISDGTTKTPFDGISDWIEKNFVWVIVGIVAIIALFMFLLPAISKKIGG